MIKNIPYIFTKQEIINSFDNDIQYDNWIANKIRSNKIAKVRKGLYVLLDVTGFPLVSKFEIASKISNDSYLCYHAAIEYYGKANQVYHTLTVASTSRFNDFTFQDIDYIRKPSKIDCGIENHFGVRVTSLERTIIDCINDLDECGGIDELLEALEQIKLLDENKLLETLNAYNCVLLYQKTGYILQYYQEQLGLSDAFFDECKKHLTNQVKYFLKNEFDDIEYNSNWKLMAPKNLISHLKQGY